MGLPKGEIFRLPQVRFIHISPFVETEMTKAQIVKVLSIITQVTVQTLFRYFGDGIPKSLHIFLIKTSMTSECLGTADLLLS